MVYRRSIAVLLAIATMAGAHRAAIASEADAREITNLMGRRAAYQVRGDVKDWVDLFSHRSDVSFYLAGQMTVGLDAIKARFGYDLPVRNAYGEHILASPILEIAGDGKTAKGLWQTFGPVAFPDANNPVDAKPVGMLNWEDSGVDFIKDNGVWKIWHFAVFSNLSLRMGETWDHKLAGIAAAPAPSGPLAPWAPGRTSPVYPVPVPYRTFTQTFSYGRVPWTGPTPTQSAQHGETR